MIKATAFKAKVLILDEPTSSLNAVEVERLFTLLRGLKKQGETIIFVSHRLEEVMLIADRISVLRDGRYIDTVERNNVTINSIISLMVGKTILHNEKISYAERAKTVLEVRNLTKLKSFEDINFQLYEKEILGIAGLEGSGRYDLVRSIFGITRFTRGRVLVDGKDLKIGHPVSAIYNQIGFLTRERKREGIFYKMSLIKNISMIKSLGHMIWNEKKYKSSTNSLIEQLQIKCAGSLQSIDELSGGNQQKAIMARIISAKPRIIIMEEPTRGIDVGSKAEIFRIMRNLANSGTSIIIISSELDDLIKECDRLLVMHRGRIAGNVMARGMIKEEIMSMATGISNDR